jgi:predicted metalloprotease
MRWKRAKRYGQIEDRRGQSRGGTFGSSAGMRGGRRIGGRGATGGGLGIIALALIGYFVFGLDPQAMMQIANQVAGPTQSQFPGQAPGQVPSQVRGQGNVGTPQDEMGQFVDAMISSTTDVWNAEFAADGQTYQAPNPLVLYEGATGTQCGTGQSAMGPFYCPADQRIYIDLTFFDELTTRFGAPGDFAQAYVLAHEVGHHLQTILGTSGQVRRAQGAANSEAEANSYSVALELQADCYAGVWAQQVDNVTGGDVALDPGDLEEGRRAAEAIGDDTLQRQARGRVVPDSFTHGTSEQRQTWLLRGFETGDPDACDTFAEMERGRL